MMTSNKQQSESAIEEVWITRTFNAPKEIVFKAWTDPVQLIKWYAPTGCEISFTEINVAEGGSFHSCIIIPDGKKCWCKGIYKEVKFPELIVQTMSVADEEGNLISAVDAGMDPRWPDETILTVTFEDTGDGKTLMTLHQTVNQALAKSTGAYPSWIIMFDRLDNLLKN